MPAHVWTVFAALIHLEEPMFGREPALILAVVHAALALAIGFGVDITTEQFALIEAFVAAVLGVIVRQNVTPVASLREGDAE